MRGISVLRALLIFTIFALILVVLWQQRKNPPRADVSKNMTPTSSSSLKLTSASFADSALIPSKYTCDGTRTLSPSLSIAGVPTGTKSLTLIMDDPDVPKAVKSDGVFDHWILFNISPETVTIPEGGSAGIAGANSAGGNAYTGPCPPRFSRSAATMKIQVWSQGEPPPAQYDPPEHRYIFTLYALDADMPLAAGASKDAVLQAMQGHIIAQTQLVGRYQRKP